MRSRKSLLCASLAIWLAACGGSSAGSSPAPAPAPAASLGALQIAGDMGAGWNLGNTLDASGAADPLADETAWGNPRTTQAMIDKVKAAGFKTLRLPVSWNDHMADGPAHAIDSAWMDRVDEVANYALRDGMYVIINVHHTRGAKSDADWLSLTSANEANARAILTALWAQVAARFARYDQHVIFEVMNEPKVQTGPGDSFDWWGSQESYGVLNRLNAAALASIRAAGGNNAARLVMLPTYAAAPNEAQVNALALPADKMIAVSIHAYNPQDFALNDSTSANSTAVFSAAGQDEVAAIFARASARFVKNGVPVVMGEWGAKNKDNLAERIKFAQYYVASAKAAGIPTVWWDNGAAARLNQFGLLDRATLSWPEPRLVGAITGLPTP
jgi:endoglucanase